VSEGVFLKQELYDSSLKLEIIIILLVNIFFYFLFAKIDFLEFLYVFSIEHEEYELDEIIPLFMTLALSLLVFSYRRLREIKKFTSNLYFMANHDQMTQIYNRRYMTDVLKVEQDRVNRSGSVFSLILLDIDDFKKVNDNYGHQAGDRVLIEFSRMLKKSIRNVDVLCRWGGEEFLILYRDTDQAGAEAIATKISEMIRLFKWDHVEPVGASMGVVSSKKEQSTDQLFLRVDNALYEAKSNGKNQYIVG